MRDTWRDSQEAKAKAVIRLQQVATSEGLSAFFFVMQQASLKVGITPHEGTRVFPAISTVAVWCALLCVECFRKRIGPELRQ